MIFGTILRLKSYKPESMVVASLVFGLALFLHEDAKSDALFHYLGVIILVLSLLCDGAIVNISERLMNHHNVDQEEVT